MKKEQPLQQLLAKYREVPIEQAHLKKVIALSQQALAENAVKRLTLSEKLISIFTILKPWIILFQIAVTVGILLTLNHLKSSISMRDLMFLLSLGVSVLVVFAFPEIMKSYSCHMAELEATFKFQLRQLLALKLTILGGIGLASVLLIALFSSVALQLPLLRILLYLSLPFTLLNGIFCLCLNKSFSKWQLSLIGMLVIGGALLCLLLRAINFYQLSLLKQIIPNLASSGLMLFSLIQIFKRKDFSL